MVAQLTLLSLCNPGRDVSVNRVTIGVNNISFILLIFYYLEGQFMEGLFDYFSIDKLTITVEQNRYN